MRAKISQGRAIRRDHFQKFIAGKATLLAAFINAILYSWLALSLAGLIAHALLSFTDHSLHEHTSLMDGKAFVVMGLIHLIFDLLLLNIIILSSKNSKTLAKIFTRTILSLFVLGDIFIACAGLVAFMHHT